ncbi:MAG: DNA primase [Dysgonamonadaceae bacterium]|jgi:DNA primase|nr:DNA primase [Dysgonamonadaceae bacterium]
MIDQLTVERIQSTARIMDVVSDFISLRKRGVNYVGLCPFHDDKNPSFYVSPSKNICKCFTCGEGGTPVHFLMKHEQLTYVDALKYLAKKYGIEVKDTPLTDEQKQAQSDRESMFILNAFAQKTFTSNLFDTQEGKTIGLAYFKERGFREDIITKFQLGYALEERDVFTQQALKAGYKKTYLEKTGLTIVGENNYMADRFRGRVIFPVQSLSGKIVAFGGRILKKEDKTAKYLNSPESEIYHKGNELYGIYFARQAIVKHDRCFLVEGYTDVLSMHQAGIENVVASSGTALTQGQIRLIQRFTANVTILYDGDAAGIKAALRGINLLLEAGLNIKVVLLPAGEDPDSFSKQQNASSFIDYIKTHETDFVRFKTSLLIEEAGADPIKKAQLIGEIVDTISVIPEEITRSVYIKECSKLLDTDERILINHIVKKRKELTAQKKKVTRTQVSEYGATPAAVIPDPTDSYGINEIPPPPPPPPPEGEAFLPETKTIDYPLDQYEQSLLYFVVRYAEYPLYYKDPETKEIPVAVIDFIMNDFRTDEIKLTNPLYQQILDEAYAKFKIEGFKSESYFILHPDPQISRLAVDLASDKYSLSKIHSKFQKIDMETDKLLELIPYEVMNYKSAMLEEQINRLSLHIKQAQETNDTEKLPELFKELATLKEIKTKLSKNLGERIVEKL